MKHLIINVNHSQSDKINLAIRLFLILYQEFTYEKNYILNIK